MKFTFFISFALYTAVIDFSNYLVVQTLKIIIFACRESQMFV